MKHMLAALLTLCLLLVCGSAGAEGMADSAKTGGASPSPTEVTGAGATLAEMGVDSRYLPWISQMAYLNGQPYGMTSFGGWRARTTIYAQTEQGMEVVWTGEGEGWGLFAMGDQLVLISEEPTDFWENLFSMYPPVGERFVEVIDPATWEAERLPITEAVPLLRVLDGELVSWGSWREDGIPRAEMYRWNGADWDEALIWTGEIPEEDSFYTELHPGFILLDQQLHDKGVRDLRIMTLADGREHLLMDVEPRYGNALDAVLDGDLLYLLGDSGLWRFDLAAGTRELLLPGMVVRFIMNGRYIIGYTSPEGTELEARIRVYDRETAALLREVAVPQEASYWVLDGDTLYLQDYTKGGYMVNGRLRVQRSYTAVIDLTTGECRTMPFVY